MQKWNAQPIMVTQTANDFKTAQESRQYKDGDHISALFKDGCIRRGVVKNANTGQDLLTVCTKTSCGDYCISGNFIESWQLEETAEQVKRKFYSRIMGIVVSGCIGFMLALMIIVLT